MRRLRGRGLSSGTSLERIAPESLTPPDVPLRSPQYLALTLDRGTRSSLTRLHKRRFNGEFLKVFAPWESNQKWVRVNPIPSPCVAMPSPSPRSSPRYAVVSLSPFFTGSRRAKLALRGLG